MTPETRAYIRGHCSASFNAIYLLSERGKQGFDGLTSKAIVAIMLPYSISDYEKAKCPQDQIMFIKKCARIQLDMKL